MTPAQVLERREADPRSPAIVGAAPEAEPPHYSADHLAGLRRFAVAITVLTLLGHGVLGFEQSYAQPLVALGAAYGTQLLLESIDAWAWRRRPRFLGRPVALFDFLLSAHITGLAVAMLLYYHERLWDVAFASTVAIASKTVFRVPVGTGTRHVFNPSNFGISVTLLAIPRVGLAMPWQFTAGLPGWGDWLFVAIIFVLGSLLNIRYTRRILVVWGFLGGFATQAAFRAVVLGATWPAVLMPATGVPAMIFSFYMVPDPATTPARPLSQLAFGAAVAGLYLVFMMLHVVYCLFFALTIVSGARGLWLYANAITASRRRVLPGDPAPGVVG